MFSRPAVAGAGDKGYERVSSPSESLEAEQRPAEAPRRRAPTARREDPQLRSLQQEVQRLAAIIEEGQRAPASPPLVPPPRVEAHRERMLSIGQSEALAEDAELRKLRTEIEKQKKATQARVCVAVPVA